MPEVVAEAAEGLDHGGSSLAIMAPVCTEARMRAAVFLPIISMYSSTVTSVRRSKLMSRYWPSHRARQVSS